MYKKERQNGASLLLNQTGKNNIRRIINEGGIDRVVISGEGEPLNNQKAIFEILSLSEGKNKFELITSAFLRPNQLESFLKKVDVLLCNSESFCNIRVSLDSFHVRNISEESYRFVLEAIANRPYGHISFSFRSIDSDKQFVADFLKKICRKSGLRLQQVGYSVLEEEYFVNNQSFSVEYKNLIKPSLFQADKTHLDIFGYIRARSLKNQRDFTLGNNIRGCQDVGLNLTIKPDGKVFFYGIESEVLANINLDKELSLCKLKEYCEANPLVNFLCTRPMERILKNMSREQVFREIIAYVNNPYWLVRELVKRDIQPSVLLQYDD